MSASLSSPQLKALVTFLESTSVRSLTLTILTTPWFIIAAAAAVEPAVRVNHRPGIDRTAFDSIPGLIRKSIEEGKIPGAVVAIGDSDGVFYSVAMGHRQTLPEPLPVRFDTLFDLASLTKPIATATAIHLLRERGEIDLEDPLSLHLPAFAGEGRDQITIRHLLVHTSGLTPDNALSDYAGEPARSIANLLRLRPRDRPGTRFRYSDVGFMLLAELVRAKTHQPIDIFAAETCFAPLGMTDTGYLPPPELRRRAAATGTRESRWMVGEVHDPRAYRLGGVAGHAGLFSTAGDLAIFARMILGRGSVDGITVLQPPTVEEMFSPQSVRGESSDAIRGLGWDKRSAYSSNRGATMTDQAIGHSGFTGTSIWIDPGLDLFVIFLSNRLHPKEKGEYLPLAGKIGTIAADAVAQIPLE